MIQSMRVATTVLHDRITYTRTYVNYVNSETFYLVC